MAESFVGTLKSELVETHFAGRPFASTFEAEIELARFIGWFNHTRLHSELKDLSPAQFEDRYSHQQELENITTN